MRHVLPLLLALTVAAPAPVAGHAAAGVKAGKAKQVSRAKGKPGKRVAKRAAAGRARPSARQRITSAPPARTEAAAPRPATLTFLPSAIGCPADMVAVAGRVCVDRYETSVVEQRTGEAWPPYFTPDRKRAGDVAAFYDTLRAKAAPSSLDASTPLPAVPAFDITPLAKSQPDVTPQGYLSADQAQSACAAAGKRLCSEAEWLTACRGEERRDYPYGSQYQQGACNVYREDHPSAMLHANAARYHDDPRNGALLVAGRPLLLKSGGSPRCASHWGSDAIYDMVGNLDEWVDDAEGAFLGGFYSRGTRAGCLARVSAHPRRYSDYSTGARCCKDPE